jgi:hypothetical protein
MCRTVRTPASISGVSWQARPRARASTRFGDEIDQLLDPTAPFRFEALGLDDKINGGTYRGKKQ